MTLLEKLNAIKAKLETGPTAQSEIMSAWDSAREALLTDKTSDFPRMVFEQVIDELGEDIDEAIALVRKQEALVMEPHLEQRLIKIERQIENLNRESDGG